MLPNSEEKSLPPCSRGISPVYSGVIAEDDLIEHTERLFGRSFANLAELDTFLGTFSTPKELIILIVEPSRLLFDTEWSGNLGQQIQKYYQELVDNLGPQMSKAPASQVVRSAILGRMMQANGLMFKASRL